MLAYDGNILLQTEHDFCESTGRCCERGYFFPNLAELLDIANSVSVWVFWT